MPSNAALIIALVGAIGSFFCPGARAEQSNGASMSPGTHWMVVDGRLSLIDEKGREKQAIKLERRTATDNTAQTLRETKAILSGDKQIALVIDHDWDTEKGGLLGSVRCLDSAGALRWEKHGIDKNRIRLSDDGDAALVIVRSTDGCSPLMDTTCNVSALVIDPKGKELFNLGPFSSINGFVMTRNGRYGWIAGVRSRSKVFVFFNTAKGVVIEKKMKDVAGGPSLGEDGIVKFVKNVYDYKAPPEPTGEARVVRVDVLGELDLK